MLKGITTIELVDVNSGEVKVIKENNFITNALKDLCQPILRNQDTLVTTLFRGEGGVGTEALLRGLILFNTTLGTNQNNYFPPLESIMVGHGGESTYTGSDLSMGSFNVNQSDVSSPNERTYVWDFTSEQANGVINSVCLTTQCGGQIGYGTLTKPERTNAALRSFSNITKSRIKVANASVSPSTRMPVFLSFSGDYLLLFDFSKFISGELRFQKINLESRSVDVFKKMPPLTSVEGWQKTTNFVGEQYTSKEDIVLNYPEGFASGGTNFGIAQDGKYLYLVEPTSSQESSVGNAWAPNASIKILKVDLQDLTYEVLSVTNTTGKALAIRSTASTFTSGCCTFGISNGYLFARSWVQTSGAEVAELFAISLTNNTTVHQIFDVNGKAAIVGVESTNASTPFTMSIQGRVCFATSSVKPNYHYSSTGFDYNVMAVVSPSDFTVKYYNTSISSLYSSGLLQFTNSQHCKLFPTDNNLYYVVEERSNEGNSSESTFNVHVYPNVLMTINNLQIPIEKTPSQTMRVTYKIIKE